MPRTILERGRRTMWTPTIRTDSPVAIYQQIVESVAIAIAAGDLGEGDDLPSVRRLAAELRINPNTAARSVKELERLGLATPRQGVGSVVAAGARAPARRIARLALERELDATVAVALELGIGLDELIDSL
ncbi:MAG TPA: GntR family transcriptional regulator, partial [Thermoanaerobaculia bacterium]|nr:GntR family transcriptional regulator [Thermoanaerobaculia bacterium]